MKKTTRLLLSTLLLTSALNAEEIVSEPNTLDDILTRTTITFGMDDNGNLNPSIFVPVYYGSKNQFFSGIGYTSGTSSEVQINEVPNAIDSKNARTSKSQDLLLNYISYSTLLYGLKVSAGIQSTFSKIESNEFGYSHGILADLTEVYTSNDNTIDLDVQRHAIRADIELPIGSFFNSRLSTSISPYTNLSVEQSTTIRPLISEVGKSSSSTVQDISYNFMYEIQIETGTFFDIGLVASYDNTPYKYDLAVPNSISRVFETKTIDITEVTTSYLVKILFEKEIIGGLNPSFGYGIKNLDTKDNVSGATVTTDETVFTIGLERRF